MTTLTLKDKDLASDLKTIAIWMGFSKNIEEWEYHSDKMSIFYADKLMSAVPGRPPRRYESVSVFLNDWKKSLVYNYDFSHALTRCKRPGFWMMHIEGLKRLVATIKPENYFAPIDDKDLFPQEHADFHEGETCA